MIIPTYLVDSRRIRIHLSQSPCSLYQMDQLPSSPLDFVVPHILVKELNTPTNALLRRRSERQAGYRIIHDCCPVIMEVKSFPKRRLKLARFNGEVLARLADARQDLGFQCYHLYKSMSMLFERSWLPHLATTGPTVLFIERRHLGV